MKHRFSLYYDILYPILKKIVGKRYGCCNKLKNCTRCCKKNGYDDWQKRVVNHDYCKARNDYFTK